MKLLNSFLFLACLFFPAKASARDLNREVLSANKKEVHTQFPRISIITSIYKGDRFIKEFLEDIVQQTIFDQCELLLINAYSPGNEEAVIKDYLKKYSNIIYVKLAEDPGLYGVWNLGIKMARAPYITNANLDDRLSFDCYQIHADYLDAHPDIDLVYSGCYVTSVPNETFCKNSSCSNTHLHSVTDFDALKMLAEWYPFPNNHPMWRTSMHAKYGFFDDTYKSSGDMEMWIRAAFLGEARFAMVNLVLGLAYENPQGLSTKSDSLWPVENQRIKDTYRDLPEGCFDHIPLLEEYKEVE